MTKFRIHSVFIALFSGILTIPAQTKSADAKFNNITVNGVEFKNSRFDPKSAKPFFDIALQMAEAYGYTATLKIDATTAQLIRVRVAEKDSCAFCTILHADYARKVGINPSKIDNISSWWNSDLYTPKEKAVLAYTDQLSEANGKNFQQVHDQLAKYYSAEEIAEISAIVINMSLWTRYKLAQGQTPYIK
jgi:AhpD family alkylhydroperoxidase